jgi:hypothetical protein
MAYIEASRANTIIKKTYSKKMAISFWSGD